MYIIKKTPWIILFLLALFVIFETIVMIFFPIYTEKKDGVFLSWLEHGYEYSNEEKLFYIDSSIYRKSVVKFEDLYDLSKEINFDNNNSTQEKFLIAYSCSSGRNFNCELMLIIFNVESDEIIFHYNFRDTNSDSLIHELVAVIIYDIDCNGTKELFIETFDKSFIYTLKDGIFVKMGDSDLNFVSNILSTIISDVLDDSTMPGLYKIITCFIIITLISVFFAIVSVLKIIIYLIKKQQGIKIIVKKVLLFVFFSIIIAIAIVYFVFTIKITLFQLIFCIYLYYLVIFNLNRRIFPNQIDLN